MNRRFCALATIFAMLFSCIPVGAMSPPTQGVSQFANSYIPVLLGDAKKDGPDWLTRTDLQLRFDSLLNPQYGIETVQPLGVLPSGQAFWQGKLATDGVGAKPTLNLGLGYRTLKGNGTKLLGVNGFYDNSFESGFSRIGLGGEFFMGNLEARANAYIPVSGSVERSRTATTKEMEQAVKGVDFEVGGALPKAPWAEVFAGGKTLLHEHSDNVTSLTARTQLQLTPHVRLEAGYQANPDNKYVKLGYTLGPSGRVSMTGMKKSDVRLPNLSNKLLQKVERDNIVRTETWTEKITGGVTGYVFGSGAALVIRSSSTAPAGYTAVNGATVSVQGQSISTSTDSTGHFTLNGIPIGTVTIVATSGALSVSGSVPVTEGPAAQTPDIGTVSTVGVLCGFVYRNGSVVIISDSQVPPPGFTPVEGGTVTITAQDGTPIAITTDASGHFVATEVPAGDATITVDDGAGHTAETSATVEAGSTETTPSAPDPVGIVEGYLYSNGHGSEVIGSTAIAPDYYARVSGVTVRIQGKPSLSATTEANGHFLIASVPAGTQTLEVVAGVVVLSGSVTITANQTAAASVGTAVVPGEVYGYAYVDDATGLNLKITNSVGAPTGYHYANNSKLVLDGQDDITIIPDGAFYYCPVWPGDHTLVFDRDGNGVVLSGGIPISMTASGSVLPLGNYTLTDSTPATGSVEGYVFTSGTDLVVQPGSTAPQGYWKLSGVTVRLGVNLSVSGASTTTDANGFFHFVDFPVADYQIDFAKTSFTTASGSVSVIAGGTTDVTISIPTAVVGVDGFVFTNGTDIIMRNTDHWAVTPLGETRVTGATLSVQGTPLVSSPSGSGGTVTLYVVPGTHTFVVTKDSVTISGPLTVNSSSWQSLGADFPHGTITGYAFVDNATKTKLHLDSDGTKPAGYSEDTTMTVLNADGFGFPIQVNTPYQMDALPGTHTLYFTNGSSINYSTTVTVTEGATVHPADYSSPGSEETVPVTGTIQGYVFTSGSDLIVQASATAPAGYWSVGDASVSATGGSATTGILGDFSFTANAGSNTITVAKSGLTTGSGSITVGANTTISVTLGSAKATTTITGRVVSDGTRVIVTTHLASQAVGTQKVQDAQVSLGGTQLTAMSDVDGLFTLHAVDGIYTLAVQKELMHVSGSITVSNPGGLQSFNIGTPFATGTISGYAYVDYATKSKLHLDSDNALAAGYSADTTMTILDANGFGGYVSDPTGMIPYSFPALPGTWDITFHNNTGVNYTTSVTVTVGATVHPADYDTPVPTGTLQGYVFSSGSALVVQASSTAPAGYWKATGATVYASNGTSTTVDANGKFSLTLPAGDLGISIDAGAVNVEGIGVTVTADTTTDMVFGVPAVSYSATGYLVTDGTMMRILPGNWWQSIPVGAQLVSGATVALDGTGLSATTDSSGLVTLNAVPASYTVTATMTGYTTLSGPFTLGSSNMTLDLGDPLTMGTVTGYAFVNGTNLHLDTDGTAPDGFAPAAGMTVKDSRGFGITVQANGAYSFSAIPGSWSITFSNGTVNYTTHADVTANATSAPPDYDTPPQLGNVEGYVLSDGSNIIINALWPTGYLAASGVTVSIGAVSATSDGGGYFLLSNVPAGTGRTLTATKTGLTSLSGTMDVVANTTTTAPDMGIPTAHGGNVAGYLFSDGTNLAMQAPSTPPAGYSAVNACQVTVTPDDSTYSAISNPTDASGRIYIPGIMEGSAVISLSYGGIDLSAPVTVLAGQTVNVPLAGTGSVQGYVYGNGSAIIVRSVESAFAGYSAIQNATVNFGGSPFATTDSSGYFKATKVPGGSQTLTATYGTFNEGGNVNVTPGATVNSPNFGTVMGSIRGYVYVDGANPTLNDIFVSHFSSGPAGYTAAAGATVNVGGETAITDASGAFTVTNVPQGMQTVTVQWNSLDPVSGSVEARAGLTVDVTDFPNLVFNNQIGALPGTVTYSITITKPGYYKIITSEYMTAANTVLDLFDSSWNKIASNDDYLDTYSYIRWSLAAGSYTIAVRDAAGGNISCRLEVVEDP